MRLHNKPVFTVLFCLYCVLLMGSVLAQPQAQPQPQQKQTVQPTPLPPDIDGNDPALPVWMRPANPTPSSKTPSTTSSAAKQPPVNEEIVPGTPGQMGTVTKEGDRFKIHSLVQNVILPVTVVDERRRLVTDLKQANFTVYEDGQPQQIINVLREDIPVSIGILVDNSGSMREKRQKVATAVLNLIKSSNRDDEVAIVNFNDEPYLDQDFTNNLNQMHEALDRLDSRGGTALYDAVIASSDHLAKAAKRDKKVLLVITDGEDNESSNSLEQAVRAVQDENGPVIYTIGILGHEGKERRAKRALEALSLQTGGVAFFPKDLGEVDEISQQIAHDIRNQYSITYKPTNPQTNGGYRTVKVVAHASGYRDLVVRTKSGYFAGSQNSKKATASNNR